jgi:hypothetical protein
MTALPLERLRRMTHVELAELLTDPNEVTRDRARQELAARLDRMPVNRPVPVVEIDDLVTASDAAELAELSPAGFRSVVVKARRAGLELVAPRELWPDQRTALYSRAAVLRYRAATERRGRSTRRVSG